MIDPNDGRVINVGQANQALDLETQKAKEIDSDILVTFDADGQHQVEDIKKVIEPILKNNADLVIGSRFLDNKTIDVPEYRKIGIKLITKVTNSTLEEKITDSQSGFRSYSSEVLSKMNLSENGMGVSTEILIGLFKILSAKETTE